MVNLKSVAWCQSTVPLRTGMIADRKANDADVVAIGIANLATHFIPHKLTAVNATTIVQATTWIGIQGKNHC